MLHALSLFPLDASAVSELNVLFSLLQHPPTICFLLLFLIAINTSACRFLSSAQDEATATFTLPPGPVRCIPGKQGSAIFCELVSSTGPRISSPACFR